MAVAVVVFDVAVAVLGSKVEAVCSSFLLPSFLPSFLSYLFAALCNLFLCDLVFSFESTNLRRLGFKMGWNR